MAPESHPIMLLERIRNCRCYWQLNYFELLRLYLTCTHTPLDSAPSKPLRPLIHLAARFAFTRTTFATFTFFVSHDFLLLINNCPLLLQSLLLMHQGTHPEVYEILHLRHTRTQLCGKESHIHRLRTRSFD